MVLSIGELTGGLKSYREVTLSSGDVVKLREITVRERKELPLDDDGALTEESFRLLVRMTLAGDEKDMLSDEELRAFEDNTPQTLQTEIGQAVVDLYAGRGEGESSPTQT